MLAQVDFWSHPLTVGVVVVCVGSLLTLIVGGGTKLLRDVGSMKTLMEVDAVHRNNLLDDVDAIGRSTSKAHSRIDDDHDVIVEHGVRITALEEWRDRQ